MYIEINILYDLIYPCTILNIHPYVRRCMHIRTHIYIGLHICWWKFVCVYQYSYIHTYLFTYTYTCCPDVYMSILHSGSLDDTGGVNYGCIQHGVIVVFVHIARKKSSFFLQLFAPSQYIYVYMHQYMYIRTYICA